VSPVLHSHGKTVLMNKKAKLAFSILMVVAGYILNSCGWMNSMVGQSSGRFLLVSGGMLLLVSGVLWFMESISK